MAHTMTTERRSSNLGGMGALLIEAARLLRQLRFSANRGAFAKGEWVAVTVDPRWSTDNKTIHVLITCHAFLPQQVDWRKLAVVVQRMDNTASFHYIASFNPAGEALFSLPPGRYSLSAYERNGKLIALERKAEPIPVHAKLAAQGVEVSTTPITEKSLDGRITATVSRTVSGVEVAFETAEETLAGAWVQFALVPHEKNKDEVSAPAPLLTGEVTLLPVSEQPPVGEQPQLWEGVWQGAVPSSGSYELLFMRAQENEA